MAEFVEFTMAPVRSSSSSMEGKVWLNSDNDSMCGEDAEDEGDGGPKDDGETKECPEDDDTVGWLGIAGDRLLDCAIRGDVMLPPGCDEDEEDLPIPLDGVMDKSRESRFVVCTDNPAS